MSISYDILPPDPLTIEHIATKRLVTRQPHQLTKAGVLSNQLRHEIVNSLTAATLNLEHFGYHHSATLSEVYQSLQELESYLRIALNS